jgi:tRNA nucleotidyltransferase/poly(A) polymerase
MKTREIYKSKFDPNINVVILFKEDKIYDGARTIFDKEDNPVIIIPEQKTLMIDGEVVSQDWFTETHLIAIEKNGVKKLQECCAKKITEKLNESPKQEKVIAYHGGPVPIRKFDPKMGAMGTMWFTEDKDKIIRGESGAASRKYIMTVEITPKKTAGWEEYDKLLLFQLKQDGYNTIKLDDDWVVFNAKDVKVINIEKVKKDQSAVNEYYDITEKHYSLEEVINKWVNDPYGKAYDEKVHGYYTPEELWKYREFNWTRKNARGGSKDWDKLSDILLDKGWDENKPLVFIIGKNGVAKVGEGNHRLAIAKEIGIDKIPVVFDFWTNVEVDQTLKNNPWFGTGRTHSPRNDIKEISINEDVKNIDNWKNWLEYKFKDKFSVIGFGTQGYAYRGSNGKVYKITQDSSEAFAANRIKGLNIPNVYEVYDVKRINNSMFLIIQKWYNESDEFYVSVFESFGDWISGSGDEEYKLIELSEDTGVSLDDVVETWEKIKLAFNTLRNKHGITFSDFVPGNVMEDEQAEPIIIDLGHSSIKGDENNIPMFERALKVAGKSNKINEWIDGPISLVKDFTPEYLAKVLKWGGISGKPKKLGTGGMGTAFKIGDKVLKITSDASEARAAANIIKLNHPNIYKVFKVGKLKGEIDHNEMFAIITEYIPSKLNGDEEFLLSFTNDLYHYVFNKDNEKADFFKKWASISLQDCNNFLSSFHVKIKPKNNRVDNKDNYKELSDKAISFIAENIWVACKSFMLCPVSNYFAWTNIKYILDRIFDVRDHYMDHYKKHKGAQIIQNEKHYLDILEFLSKAQTLIRSKSATTIDKVFNAVAYLRSVGVIFEDFHKGNVLKRSNGEPVLIDLGVSESKDVQIDVLEGKRNEAGKNKLNESVGYPKEIYEENDYGNVSGVVHDSMDNVRNWMRKERLDDMAYNKISSLGVPITLLKNINVEEEHRGKNFGTELFESFLNESEGSVILISDISESNEFDLTEWYKSYKFKVIGYSGSLPILLLEKNIKTINESVGKEPSKQQIVNDIKKERNNLAQWLKAKDVNQLKYSLKYLSITDFVDSVRARIPAMTGSDRNKVNKIKREIKSKGGFILPVYIEHGDNYKFILEGRHRIIAFYELGIKNIPVVFVRKEIKNINESVGKIVDNKMYHCTNPKNIDLILKNGLMINQTSTYTIGHTKDLIKRIYGVNPIFLSTTLYTEYCENAAVFEVDVTGLELYTDVPSLMDHGALVDQNGFWFEDTSEPAPWYLFAETGNDSGEFSYDEIFDNREDMLLGSIKTTGTAACLQNIPPNKIILVDECLSENKLNESVGEEPKTWVVDDSPAAIEDEQYDAQGEMQQFLGPDDEPEDLFGDDYEVIPISKMDIDWDGIKRMQQGEGSWARKTIDSLKNAMVNGSPVPPVTMWGNDPRPGGWRLCSGRHRVVAAKELGMTHVPALRMYWRDSDNELNESSGGSEPSKLQIDTTLQLLKSLIQGTKYSGNAFLAGGAVRDSVMGKDSKDLDVTVSLENGGIELAEFIAKKLGIFKPNSNPVTFPKFGTAMVNLNGVVYKGVTLDGVELEFVHTRQEKYKEGDRRPITSHGTIQQDVERRDLTINSLLMDLVSGKVLDLTGKGLTDIKTGIIRTPLPPETIFLEDPLRLLRAVRFAGRYNFTIPDYMKEAIKKMAPYLNSISKERIDEELYKILKGNNPDNGVTMLFDLNLIPYIAPELEHHKEQAVTGARTGHDYISKLALMMMENTPNDVLVMCKRLKMSNTQIKMLHTFVSSMQNIMDDSSSASIIKYGHEFYKVLGNEYLRYLSSVDKSVKDLIDYIISGPAVHILPNELMQLGVPKGPEIGKLVNKQKELWYSKPMISKDEMLRRIKL